MCTVGGQGGWKPYYLENKCVVRVSFADTCAGMQALEAAEASKPRLWHDMASARHLTATYLSRRRAA